MKTLTRKIMAVLLCMPGALPLQALQAAEITEEVVAAPATAAPVATSFSVEQLEQLVAPIALYPDALLTQIMMAATYPLEIVQAERWMKKNPGLEGKALDEALKGQGWDPSIKSLCSLPDVLTRLNENLDWTQDLGDAFLGQRVELLDTVQRMRGKAYEAGNLKTTEQQVITQEPDKIIVIEQASPEVVYVPSYSPTVVYGASWGYPSYYYPPMYAPPPPGYGLMAFGVGMAVGGAIWGDCNWGWGGGDVDVDIDNYNNFNRNTDISGGDRTRTGGDRTQTGGGRGEGGGWQHDPSHRKGVGYRDQGTANKYGAANGQNRVSSDQARGRSQTGASNRAGSATTSDRQRSTGASGRASSATASDRQRSSTGASNRSGSATTSDRQRSTGASSANRDRSAGSTSRSSPRTSQSSSRNSVSSGARNPSADRSASSRGASSRGSRSYGGGGRSGGGGRRR